MKAETKVSVIVPTYNNEATIGAALDSVFAQKFEGGVEVIVVNDGSTDGTRLVLAKFADRIRVIDQQRRGVSAARNVAIRAATGKYIALLDADDLWQEKLLSKTVKVLEENPACVAAFSDGALVDAAGVEVAPNFVEPQCYHSPTFDEMLSRIWPVMVSSTIIRRETLSETGGFPEEFGPNDYFGEDSYAFLLLRERGEIAFLPEKLICYRSTDFTLRLTKRLPPHEVGGKSGDSVTTDPERYTTGDRIFARLVLERYGARGRVLADTAMRRVAGDEVNLGMLAMHHGNRSYARRCYRAAIRNRPSDLRTYFRCAWTLLPAGVARLLLPMFSPHLRRSLSGPPLLANRPQ